MPKKEIINLGDIVKLVNDEEKNSKDISRYYIIAMSEVNKKTLIGLMSGRFLDEGVYSFNLHTPITISQLNLLGKNKFKNLGPLLTEKDEIKNFFEAYFFSKKFIK